MTILLWQKPLTQVVRQIVQRDNGAWFDPEDMSTMFQDAAGTTPVTAVEQPVGLILDKSDNGNHATQPITASRPTLSARYNLLTKTEDFSDAVWAKNGVSVTASKFLSPIGTFTANKVTLLSGVVTTGNDGGGTFAYPLITANGSVYTLSLFAKSAGSNYIRFREAINTGQRVKINLTDGSFVGEAGWVPSTFTVSVTPAPNGFFLIQITRSAPTTFCFNIKGGDDVGNGINGVYVWGIDLRLGTTSGPYQRVNTATDYDTNPDLFPKYLKFDGIDDYLILSGLNILGNFYVAAAVQYSGTAEHVIDSFGAAGIRAGLRRSSSKQLSIVDNLATYSSSDIDGGLQIDSVIFRNNNSDLFKNAKLVQNFGTFARSGTITSANIGCDYTATGGYHNGRIYGLILLSKEPTDAQRVKCERFLTKKAGAML